jgi:hypothetical protein
MILLDVGLNSFLRLVSVGLSRSEVETHSWTTVELLMQITGTVFCTLLVPVGYFKTCTGVRAACVEMNDRISYYIFYD